MTAKEILQYILTNNGITYDVKSNNRIEHNFGFYASLKRLGEKIPLKKFCIQDIENFLLTQFLENEFLGIWIDKDMVYLDITKHFPSLENALKFGKRNKQKAIWDCTNKREIVL